MIRDSELSGNFKNDGEIDFDNEDWFYVDKGRQNGPISGFALRQMFISGELDRDVQVWKQGFADWEPFLATELAHGTSSGPPPISAKFIPNGYVWVIAFLPLIFAIIDATYLRSRYGPFAVGLAQAGWRLIDWRISIPAYSLLCVLDRHSLLKAGYRSPYLLFSAFVVPIYLFVRAHRVGQTPYYAFVFLLNFFLVILFF